MADLQFLSGLNTIGGNIIDIQSGLGRVVFDYGAILDTETGELPDLNCKELETAIFISHLHLDHTGSLSFVPKDIPIYMSKESYSLYESLVKVGESKTIEAKIHPIDYDRTITVGDIEVTLKESDHDIRGIAAFFIQTPDFKLINSGDVRLTGNYPEKVKNWVNEAKLFEPDALLLEGTSFSFIKEETEEELEELEQNLEACDQQIEEEKIERIASEEELYEKWVELINENQKSIIFMNTYIRNTDRLSRLVNYTNKQNRQMVLEPEYAFLIETLEENQDFLVIEEFDKNQEFKSRWVSIEELVKAPEKYVIQNSYEHLSLLEHFEEGIYCHSNGEPLGDYDPRYEIFINTIEENNFEFKNFGTSGHANKEDLVWLAKEINATTTVPWHSFHPEEMAKELVFEGLNTFLPQRKTIYSIKKINR